MSLLLHSRAIARSVLGELEPSEDERLRAHLRACAACRGRYDELAGAARSVSAGTGAASRERARLFATLERGQSTPAPPRRARAWLGAGLVLAPAAAVVLWLARPAPAPDDVVTMRGGAEQPTAAPASVVLYASRRTGPATREPLRLVGELPGSGEARVSLEDYLQLAVRGLRAPAHVRVAVVDEGGAIKHLVGDTVLSPRAGSAPLTLGDSVDVARALAAGRARIVALFSGAAIDDDTVREAAARLQSARVERGAARAAVVTGRLVIEK